MSRLTPASDGDGALLDVDGEDAVDAGAEHDVAARVLRGVAVAAAEPTRDDAPRRGRGDARRRRRSSSSRPVHGRERRRSAAPAASAARSVARASSGTMHRDREGRPPTARPSRAAPDRRGRDLRGHRPGPVRAGTRSAGCRARTARSTARTRPGLPTAADFSNAHRQYARIVTLDDDRAHVAEERARVQPSASGDDSPARSPSSTQLGVALPRDHEQRRRRPRRSGTTARSRRRPRHRPRSCAARSPTATHARSSTGFVLQPQAVRDRQHDSSRRSRARAASAPRTTARSTRRSARRRRRSRCAPGPRRPRPDGRASRDARRSASTSSASLMK